MTKQERTIDQLKILWWAMSPEQRDQFIDDECSPREVLLLDQAGYLNWTPLTTDSAAKGLWPRKKKKRNAS